MTRIQSNRPVAAARTETAAKPAAQQAPAKAEVSKGWAPKAAGAVGRASAAKVPDVAAHARAVVESFVAGNKAMTQVDIVGSTVQHNKAAEAMVQTLATELASQYRDRGNEKAAAKVEKDLASFTRSLGPVKGYYVDPDRGSMAAVEDNGVRSEKLNFKMQELANKLDQVNAEPAGEHQQAYNRHAGGTLISAEAKLLGALGEAMVNGDSNVAEKTLSFLKALPKKVDSQIESRGGSMEPLERAGGAARAINDFVAKNLN